MVQLSDEGIKNWGSVYKSGGSGSGRPVLKHNDIIGIVTRDQVKDGHANIMRLYHSRFNNNSWSTNFWKPIEQEQIDKLSMEEKMHLDEVVRELKGS